MKPVSLVCVILQTLACASSSNVSTHAAIQYDLALVHANVVDVERGIVVPDQTILVSGNRIVDVHASTNSRVRAGAQVDANGTFVMPGLWDMHGHVLSNYERFANVLLPNGITGIRQPGNNRLDTLRAVRARLPRATSPLPRLVVAGVLIDDSPAARPAGSVTLTRAEDASLLADSLIRSGVDFFKVYSRIKREPFFALAAEARRRGVSLTGHVPRALTPEEISDAGMRSIEHVFEFPLACSTREVDMRQQYALAESNTNARAARMAVGDTVLHTYDRNKCLRIIRHLVRNGTFVTPTLYLYRRMSGIAEPTARDSTIAAYFAGGLPQPGARLPEFGATEERARRLYDRLAELVREMNRAGLLLLAGTDTDAPLLWAGFSLHDELVALVEDGGLTPAEALRTATLNPARYFSASDTMGVVAPGKVADLVLLLANPLRDIRNTQRITGVVVNGRYLHRKELDQMLAAATKEAIR